MLERNCVPSADRIRVAPFMQKYFIKLPANDGRIPQKLFESTAVLPNGIRTVTTEDGAIWLANGNGITRLAAEGEYKLDRISYFSAPRYLFDNNIRAMMADRNGIWVATDGGVSHIWYESITYEKKAAVRAATALYQSPVLKEKGILSALPTRAPTTTVSGPQCTPQVPVTNSP